MTSRIPDELPLCQGRKQYGQRNRRRVVWNQVWDGVARVLVHVILIVEWVQEQLEHLFWSDSDEHTVLEPRDMENGNGNRHMKTFPEPVTDLNVPAVSHSLRKEGDQEHCYNDRLRTSPLTMPLAQDEISAIAEAPREEAQSQALHFLTRPIRHLSQALLGKTLGSEDTTSSSSFWQCIGVGRSQDSRMSQRNAPSWVFGRSTHQEDREETQRGSVSTYVISDSTSEAGSTEQKNADTARNWNAIELPFSNQRLSFWVAEEGVIRSRVIEQTGLMPESYHNLRNKKSDDSFEVTTRYIAAYDEFKHSLTSSDILHGPSQVVAPFVTDTILPSTVFSDKSTFKYSQVKSSAESKVPNREACELLMDPGKSALPPRPRSMSLGCELGRISLASLSTVYQYDPEKREFLVRSPEENNERPITIVRNYVEANNRQVAEAQQKLVANGGKFVR
ncbi:MAG: hypothetical protein Q9157_003989 [Trypethelium eluteriae]